MTATRTIAKRGAQATRKLPGKRRAATKGARLGTAAIRRNAYLQALLHNRKVRDDLQQALTSGRVVYLRATRRGDAAEALLDDRKTRRELKRMVAALRNSRARAQREQAKRRRKRILAALTLVTAGGLLAALAAKKASQQGDGADTSDGIEQREHGHDLPLENGTTAYQPPPG